MVIRNNMFVHSSKFCGLVADDQIQPNAMEVTLDELYRIDTDSVFELSDTDKTMRSRKLVLPDYGDHENYYSLVPGQYQFESYIACDIPEGIVGWLIARSTLNRNGIFIYSGLYDSGFKSPTIGGILYVNCNAYIKYKTRIAQFVTAQAETFHLYNGQYQNNNGI